jgi:hypothetical protein
MLPPAPAADCSLLQALFQSDHGCRQARTTALLHLTLSRFSQFECRARAKQRAGRSLRGGTTRSLPVPISSPMHLRPLARTSCLSAACSGGWLQRAECVRTRVRACTPLAAAPAGQPAAKTSSKGPALRVRQAVLSDVPEVARVCTEVHLHLPMHCCIVSCARRCIESCHK